MPYTGQPSAAQASSPTPLQITLHARLTVSILRTHQVLYDAENRRSFHVATNRKVLRQNRLARAHYKSARMLIVVIRDYRHQHTRVTCIRYILQNFLGNV